MINNVFFGGLGAEECSCDNGMDSDRCDFHIAMYDIGFPECSEVVVFARTLSITRIAEDSTIIADCVSFILVDTLYLAGEIVDDGHKSHLQFTDFFDLIKDWSEIFPTLGAYLNFIM